jgi:hypothetical protein
MGDMRGRRLTRNDWARAAGSIPLSQISLIGLEPREGVPACQPGCASSCWPDSVLVLVLALVVWLPLLSLLLSLSPSPSPSRPPPTIPIPTFLGHTRYIDGTFTVHGRRPSRLVLPHRAAVPARQRYLTA